MANTEDRWIESGSDVERLVFFSDAVFAIAITLLALEIRAPGMQDPGAAELTTALLGVWPALSSLAISFWIVGTLWLAHHRVFHYITSYDRRLLLINLLLLMWVALMPFSGSLLGEYGGYRISVIVFYCAHMIVASLNFWWLWWYAIEHRKLVAHEVAPRVIRYNTMRYILMSPIFLLAIAISFVDVNDAEWSLLILLLVRPVAVRYARLHKPSWARREPSK